MFHLLVVIGWLPLWVLYRLSDATAVVLRFVVRYRLKVVRKNLQESFPDKSQRQLRRIEWQYYRHLSDLLFEGIYNLRATPRQLLKRYQVVNRELADRYYEQGRSVILMSAHFNNWEYMVSTLNLQFRHHGVGVGKPLSNKRFGRQLNQRRTALGTQVVDQTNVRQEMEYYHRYQVPVAYMMLGDQSPSSPKRCFRTSFLNHPDTAFLYGSEHFARKYNYPVLYYQVDKVRRGHYRITLEELCPDPLSLPEGAITQTYAARLERTILQAPQYWLWSHRRWKF